MILISRFYAQKYMYVYSQSHSGKPTPDATPLPPFESAPKTKSPTPEGVGLFVAITDRIDAVAFRI